MRARALNDGPVRDGPVLYWMVSHRRLHHNAALDHAVAEAKRLGRGLILLEGLRFDDPYGSARIHAFVHAGMLDNQVAAGAAGIQYIPALETRAGEHSGLLARLAKRVCIIVTDDSLQHFLPRMLVAASRLPVRMVAVDGDGLLPRSATEAPFATAVSFRRFLQRNLPDHLQWPAPNPLDGLPETDGSIGGVPDEIPGLPAVEGHPNHVPPSSLAGGAAAGDARLQAFDVRSYLEARHPDAEATSGLSPYLHFGHVGAHQAAGAILDDEGWDPSRLGGDMRGARRGWWGVDEPAEAFLDQLVTWRELGHVDRFYRPNNDEWGTLPDWAKDTLTAHQDDPRTVLDYADLEGARTPDPVWNAAQRQLLQEGIIHNHLRMLWGKRILTWTKTPQDALAVMLRLNDTYALDGRDPNSISGIMWCLGRFDRGWPERDVFGKVRCMTSASTSSKLRMKDYLARFGEAPGQ